MATKAISTSWEGVQRLPPFYPAQLVEQILRGIRHTQDAEQREAQEIEGALLVQAISRASSLQNTPPDLQARLQEQDLAHKLDHAKVTFKFKDGRSTRLNLQWKGSYKDEYTGDILPHNNIREAMLDEIAYLCDEVLEGVEVDDVMKDPERVIVGGRWVTHNKQDTQNPKCRGRYVAQEVNVGVRPMPHFMRPPHH